LHERTENVSESGWNPSAIAKKLHVPTYDEILEKIKSRYPRRSRYKSLLEAEIARLQTTFNILISKTDFIKSLVSLLDSLHPFFWSLIEIEFNKNEIKKSIKCIAKARKLASSFWEKYRYLLMGADDPKELRILASEGRGRMLSQIKRCRKSLITLRSLVVFLSKLPAIDPSLKTIIVAGAPSTGKSTFVASASRARPKISPYPFTTKTIHVGHVDIANTKIQLIDTPGILDRPPERMNTIERKAVAAFNNIDGVILLMIDVSDAPAIEVENQFRILETLNLLNKKDIYLFINKIDISNKSNLEKARSIAYELYENKKVKRVFEGVALDRDLVRRVILSISEDEGWIKA